MLDVPPPPALYHGLIDPQPEVHLQPMQIPPAQQVPIDAAQPEPVELAPVVLLPVPTMAISPDVLQETEGGQQSADTLPAQATILQKTDSEGGPNERWRQAVAVTPPLYNNNSRNRGTYRPPNSCSLDISSLATALSLMQTVGLQPTIIIE